MIRLQYFNEQTGADRTGQGHFLQRTGCTISDSAFSIYRGCVPARRDLCGEVGNSEIPNRRTDEFKSQEAMSILGFLASELDRAWTLTQFETLFFKGD
jgi:hypothetical protein